MDLNTLILLAFGAQLGAGVFGLVRGAQRGLPSLTASAPAILIATALHVPLLFVANARDGEAGSMGMIFVSVAAATTVALTGIGVALGEVGRRMRQEAG